MDTEPTTDGDTYARRLLGLQTAWWKQIVPVQLPYRWNLRRLRPGFVLDVGCGLGRNLHHLGGAGVGVDHNEALVAAARERGLTAFTPDGFETSDFARPEVFDSLLASHVVEHMTVQEATGLLAGYLRYVKNGGKVLLVTPQERGFAADPTHVTFMALPEITEMFETLGVDLIRSYSFPFPRAVGRVFVYNEFVFVGQKA